VPGVGLDLTGGTGFVAATRRQVEHHLRLQELVQAHTANRDVDTDGSLPEGGIVEFVEHPLLLARPSLYPRQRTILRLIFCEDLSDYDQEVVAEWTARFSRGGDVEGVAPDVLRRIEWCKAQGRRWFREVEFIGGRRGSKTMLGSYCAAYLAYRLCRMRNPQDFYGVVPGKELASFVMAQGEDQAKAYQYADLADAIRYGPCFDPYRSSIDTTSRIALRTEFDKARQDLLEAEGRGREVASIVVQALPTNARVGRGPAAFCLLFDELAHLISSSQGPAASEEVYGALTPALDQMHGEGLIFIGTSPWQKLGQAYATYQDGLATEPDGSPSYPDILVLQHSSWAPYEGWRDPRSTGGITMDPPPQSYDDNLRRLERRDPVKFRVERRAQWAEVIDAYLDRGVVERIFEPVPNFKRWPQDWWERIRTSPHDAGFDPADVRRLTPQNTGILRFAYRGHCDPGQSQHRLVYGISHTEVFLHRMPDDPRTGEEVWTPYHHVFVDLLRAYDPADYPDHQIPYVDQVEPDMVQDITGFYTLEEFTFDQFSSLLTVPLLRRQLQQAGHRARVREIRHTGPSKRLRWERTKTALGLGWVHAPKDSLFGDDGGSLLEAELTYLQRRGDSVGPPTVGPVTTDDAADVLSVLVSESLADQIDRHLAREAFATTPLAAGARGGYRSGTYPYPGMTGNYFPGAAPHADEWLRGRSGLDEWAHQRAMERGAYGNARGDSGPLGTERARRKRRGKPPTRR
jgi:hypothetical protein